MKRAANPQPLVEGQQPAAGWLFPYVISVETPWPIEITIGDRMPIECNFGVPFGRGYNPRKSTMEVFISHKNGKQLHPRDPLASPRLLDPTAPTRVGDITSNFSTPGVTFSSTFQGHTLRLKVVVHAEFELPEGHREKKDAEFYSPEIKVLRGEWDPVLQERVEM